MPDYLFVCVRGGVDSDHDRPFVCLCRGGVDFFLFPNFIVIFNSYKHYNFRFSLLFFQ